MRVACIVWCLLWKSGRLGAGPRPRKVYASRSDDLAAYVQNDGFMVDEALNSLRKHNPKLLFLYLGPFPFPSQRQGVGLGYSGQAPWAKRERRRASAPRASATWKP